MKKEQNKRKSIIYLIVGVTVLLLIVIGATYAFFQAQINESATVNMNATTGTTDHLYFYMSDIDTNSDTTLDEHNADNGKENTEIIINANQDNFSLDDKSLSDGVKAKATLTANNATNTAKAKYNVFFVIEENDFEYTVDESTPEVVLNVTNPEGKEVETIKGLNKTEKGFDITRRSKAAFLIASDVDIEATDKEATQEWQVKVTLINLESNQNNNTGKTLSGKVIITTENRDDVYELTKIGETTSVTTTYNSITLTPAIEDGTVQVAKYYYGIREIGEAGISTVSEIQYGEATDETSHTFEGLSEKHEYEVACYTVDAEGVKSGNEFSTTVTTDAYKMPVINNVTFEPELFSIKATVDAKGQDGEITTYHYYQGEELKYSGQESEYTFEGLSDTQSYTLKVEVEDENGRKASHSETVSTKTYEKATINTITPTKTWNTITLDVEATNGSMEVEEYWYEVKKEEVTVKEWYQGNKHEIITELDPNIEYTINVKVKDELGRESEVKTEKVTTDEYQNVKIEVIPSKDDTSITLNVKATEGTGTVEKYMYKREPGEWETVESTSLEDTKVYDQLTSGAPQTIKVKVIDSNGKESNLYEATITPTIKVTTTFNANGNQIDKEQEICYIDKDKQEESCNVTTPNITAPGNTPNIVGFSTDSSAHEASIKGNQVISVNKDETYYAITTAPEITYNVTYLKGIGVTATGKESDSCTIDAKYNGEQQGTECEITLPTITSESGYIIDGWYNGETKVGDQSQTIRINASGTYTAYNNPYVSGVTVTGTAWNSITVNIGTVATHGDITKYYCSSNNGTNYTESTTNSCTMTGLSPNQPYTIRVYVEDVKQRRSNEATTPGQTATYTPSTVTINGTPTSDGTSITISYIGTNGTGTIKEYRFFLNGGQVGSANNTAGTFTYTYDSGITAGGTYTVKVQAVDNEINPGTGQNFVSLFSNEVSVNTTPPSYHETCSDGSASCTIAKKVSSDTTLIYHDGTNKSGDTVIDANDKSYRYSGKSDIVNNYVCLGANNAATGACDKNDLYRIIGLFPNASGEYEMKLIKNTPYEGSDAETGSSYTASGKGYRWSGSSSNQKNTWKDSTLNTVTLNQNYIKTLPSYVQNKITTHTYITGGNTSANIQSKYVYEAYKNEINNPDIGQYATEEDRTYDKGKIGLMYASDYGYGAYKDAWTAKKLTYYDDANVTANNWLYINDNKTNEWLITRTSDVSDYVFLVYDAGYVYYSTTYVYGRVYAVRPVFYLESSAAIMPGGTGEKTTPFRIS